MANPLIEKCKRANPHPEELKEILASGVDVNAFVEMGPDKCTALLLVLDWSETREANVKVLLEAGADPRFQGPFGFTALIQCAEQNLPGCARLLVEADPSPEHLELKHVQGGTALELAKEKGNQEIVDIIEGAMKIPHD